MIYQIIQDIPADLPQYLQINFYLVALAEQRETKIVQHKHSVHNNFRMVAHFLLKVETKKKKTLKVSTASNGIVTIQLYCNVL